MTKAKKDRLKKGKEQERKLKEFYKSTCSSHYDTSNGEIKTYSESTGLTTIRRHGA